MAGKDTGCPGTSNSKREDPTQPHGFEEWNVEDNEHNIMSEDLMNSHFLYLDKLEKEGKCIPDSCATCLKEVLTQQQNQPDKSETNLKLPISPSVASNKSHKKDGEKCSFFDVSNDEGELRHDKSYSIITNKKEWNVVSAPPDLKKADLDKLKAQVIEDKTCDCDMTENVIIKRINDSSTNDRECFIVKRKKCKHELAKEKKSQSEFPKPSLNQKQPAQRKKTEQLFDDNVNSTLNDCSCPEQFDYKTNLKRASSSRKCKIHQAPVINSKSDENDQDCSPREGCLEKGKRGGSIPNKFIRVEAIKLKKHKGFDTISKSDAKTFQDECKSGSDENLDEFEKLDKTRPSEKSTRDVGSCADEQKRNHLISKGSFVKVYKLTKKQPFGKEPGTKSNEEPADHAEQGQCPDSGCSCFLCMSEKNPCKNNDTGEQIETVSSRENCSIINEKHEAIMKTREIVWGNNIPPELILQNTTYAIRHADCCVGNRLVSEFEYIPRYICPKYGAYRIGESENEHIDRSNNYETNKYLGQKQIYNDNMRKPCDAPVESHDFVNEMKEKPFTGDKCYRGPSYPCKTNQGRKIHPINSPGVKEPDKKSNRRVDGCSLNNSVRPLEDVQSTNCDDRSCGTINRGSVNRPIRPQQEVELIIDLDDRHSRRIDRGVLNNSVRPQQNSETCEYDDRRSRKLDRGSSYPMKQQENYDSETVEYVDQCNRTIDKRDQDYPLKPQEDAEKSNKCPQTRVEVGCSGKSTRLDGDQLYGKWSPIQRCDTCDLLLTDNLKRNSTKKCGTDQRLNESNYTSFVGLETVPSTDNGKDIDLPSRYKNPVENEDEISRSGCRNRRDHIENCDCDRKTLDKKGSNSSRDDENPEQTFCSNDKRSNSCTTPQIQTDNICSEVTKSLSNCCKLLTRCLSLISEKELKNNEVINLPSSDKQVPNKEDPSPNTEKLASKLKESKLSIKPSSAEKPGENFCVDSNCNNYCQQQKTGPSTQSPLKKLPCINSNDQQPSIAVCCKDSFHNLSEQKRKADYTRTSVGSKKPLNTEENKIKVTEDVVCCDCDSCQCRSLNKRKGHQSHTSHADKCCEEACECFTGCKKN